MLPPLKPTPKHLEIAISLLTLMIFGLSFKEALYSWNIDNCGFSAECLGMWLFLLVFTKAVRFFLTEEDRAHGMKQS